METILQDLRFAARSLRKSPGFTLVAALTLALGVGAATAIFTVVNSVLLRPLDLADPARLVVVWERAPGGTNDENYTSPATFFTWRDESRSFERLGYVYERPLSVTGEGEPLEAQVQVVSPDLFSILGARALTGRPLVESDAVEGQPAEVAVLSQRLWQERYGGDPGVVGRTIVVGGTPRVIAGVMPADFKILDRRADLWLPTVPPRDALGRYITVLGRLRSGTTLRQAQEEMDAIHARIAEARPEFNTGWSTHLVPLQEQVVGEVRPALLVMLGAVGMLLLIACANVANLLLSRASARRKEIAVRLSLGASRGRVVRQLLTESLLLAGFGGALGVGIAYAGTGALVGLLPEQLGLPRLDEIGMDLRALGFALGTILLTGVLFGLFPALSSSRTDLQEALKDSGRGTTGDRSRSRTRGALIVAEVGLALMLLVGAGLLMRSFWALRSVEPGVQAEGVLTLRLSLTSERYRDREALVALADELMPRLEGLPGVRAAGGVWYLPFTGVKSRDEITVVGRPQPRPGEGHGADVRPVAGDYFRAMGIPLLRGRTFDARDRADAPPAYVINQALADEAFPGEDPIGKRIALNWGEPIVGEIVGVVGDVREMGPIEAPSTALYVPFAHLPGPSLGVAIRSDGDPLALAAAARAVVREIDPNQPVAEVRLLEEMVGNAIARPRLNMFLLSVFSGMALLLAAIGLYGVISYGVAQRRHELGVRVALGASAADVLRLVVGGGMALTLTGLALGLAGSLALSRVLSGLLFGVSATDPATLAAVSLFLAGVALVASWIPARRASRVDPVSALRAD